MKFANPGALLLCLFLGGCVAPPLEPRDATPGVPHLTVMTYNVHQDRWNDEATITAVGGAGADIVCLQETSAAWQRVLTERYAGQYPVMLFAAREDFGGLAVLSKYPLEDLGVRHYGTDFHPTWFVIADTPGGRVQVFNVHLRATVDGDRDPVSNVFSAGGDHVAELASYMQGSDPALPTLVVGDFNENPQGHAVRWLEGRGFKNALPLFRPGQFTWKMKSLAGLSNMTIDHVMFDGAFTPLSSWVYGSGGSDHLPVLAQLELPPR